MLSYITTSLFESSIRVGRKFVVPLSDIGLDLLRYSAAADRTLGEQLRALPATDQVAARDEDNTNISVHTYFALSFPLQLL